eukprot:TRINITY_DN1511_c0_g1_i12.p1 TRINITY_DN1511_c0_g1~~TRINITY_DN1511_c0_g1_i12.p1  ORF type:complete len:263 (-),score=76.57 TRINITY_DN1511_c0_g1_i12:71-859(-)
MGDFKVNCANWRNWSSRQIEYLIRKGVVCWKKVEKSFDVKLAEEVSQLRSLVNIEKKLVEETKAEMVGAQKERSKAQEELERTKAELEDTKRRLMLAQEDVEFGCSKIIELEEKLGLAAVEVTKERDKVVVLEQEVERERKERSLLCVKQMDETTNLKELLKEKETEINQMKEARKRLEEVMKVECDKIEAENERVHEEYNELVDRFEEVVKELEVVEEKNKYYKKKLVEQEEVIEFLRRTVKTYDDECDKSFKARGRGRRR